MEFLQPPVFLICVYCYGFNVCFDVFCVTVIISPFMVISFLLGSLSMVVDFPFTFRSIMVVFHSKG